LAKMSMDLYLKRADDRRFTAPNGAIFDVK
jgi:hypothetical protein